MEEVLDFDSIPEGYEVAFPRKETPSQRRVRLVEMYAGMLASKEDADVTSGVHLILAEAVELANAVIAETTEDQ